jgi:hypothetical protein
LASFIPVAMLPLPCRSLNRVIDIVWNLEEQPIPETKTTFPWDPHGEAVNSGQDGMPAATRHHRRLGHLNPWVGAQELCIRLPFA